MQAFLSHISEEAPLAAVLKEWIESTFIGHCRVFVSTDRSDLPAGTRWLDRIEAALTESSVLLVLCSPLSISRPWVNFEAGCGWMKHIPIVPICHSGLTKSALPSPLSSFQALELADETFPAALFEALAKHFGVKKLPRLTYAEMTADLIAAQALIENRLPSPASLDSRQSEMRADDIHIRILKFLSDHEHYEPTVLNVAATTGTSTAKSKHHLENLQQRQLVEPLYNHRRSEVTYEVTREGRALLARLDLL